MKIKNVILPGGKYDIPGPDCGYLVVGFNGITGNGGSGFTFSHK